jgi:succinoglycan biosynthesis transport protein ExoP
MNFATHNNTGSTSDLAWNPLELVHALRTRVRWWAIPAVACAVVAAVYSFVAPRNWSATQSLIVRPEAASVSDERLGKFSDLSEMKTLQETILELTKSQGVVTATLREVGPPRKYRRPEQWPTQLDIEEFRECVDMRPPGGAEFGKTEVFYLSVCDHDRDRASALVAALCRQLETRMQQLRDQRAQSMIAELERTVAMANGDLAAQTKTLSHFEAKIGADLNELRSLNAQVGTQGGVSQELQTIEAERRANESTLRENIRLLKLLTSAQGDDEKILATPNSLLKSQPAVKQLKDALVAAQIRTASLLGSRSEEHPFVVASRESERLIKEQLHNEIAVAIRGLQVDAELGADRETALAGKWSVSRERISRLAQSRAEYANLVASVENHSKLVEAARKNLADARARQAGALSASVISRIDGVEAGIYPVGLSRKTITAAGGIGGLIFGVGIVFLFAGPQPTGGVTPVRPIATVATNGFTAAKNGKPRDCTPAATACNGNATCTTPVAAKTDVNLFSGMTLEQAIRSVENHG